MDYTDRQLEVLQDLKHLRTAWWEAEGNPGAQRDITRAMRILYVRGCDERLGLPDDEFIIHPPVIELPFEVEVRIPQMRVDYTLFAFLAGSGLGGLATWLLAS